MIQNTFLSPILANWPGFAAMLGIFILVKIVTSASFKGWFGETMTNRGLSRLDPDLYRHFHDLYLPRPDGKGSTQIDHVVVSPFGIFVIETKNYRGWIFGSETQRQWTQQIYRRKSRFQNPLHQNHLHVRALMEFLELPEDRFHSVVFFIGDATFKTPMPANVLNRGLVSWIRNHTSTLLENSNVQSIGFRLDALDRSTDRRRVAKQHLAAMASRKAT